MTEVSTRAESSTAKCSGQSRPHCDWHSSRKSRSPYNSASRSARSKSGALRTIRYSLGGRFTPSPDASQLVPAATAAQFWAFSKTSCRVSRAVFWVVPSSTAASAGDIPRNPCREPGFCRRQSQHQQQVRRIASAAIVRVGYQHWDRRLVTNPVCIGNY